MKKQSGFTLIELLVVVSIISLLSSIVFSAVNNARSKGRDAKRQQDIHQIQNALELYYAANGQYPIFGWPMSNNPTTWGPFQTALSPYISSLPHDPIEDTDTSHMAYSGYQLYGYYGAGYGCSGQWYMIVYTLENGSASYNPSVTTCDGTTFQYPGVGGNRTKTVGVGRGS